ncbi:CubicO group peptidase (beta-lactamase class C family) [Thermocatellispora tengchongensis]|uniref:CubicO group peptidase (Beta-lactamase class C family) n=1 Tax=Thermocatellispora tengchongensis TaxID=1073253 RepID=A0A840PG67_9ACTN|nr:serine hydrolase domain-containing protein [Thermocatellispora tengchongensis]MBB5136943.1 CubicO group peptidase (beta-lactamase class C family) [Thermocatellispora tengchongensis]
MNPTGRASMRDHIQKAVDDGVWPAVQFAVARHGEILAFESFGDARDSDRFCLFSATKPVVASLVWQLLDEGLIELGTRVAEVWPGFGAYGKDVVTLEQVLLHTCGFPAAVISRDAIASREKRAAEMEAWPLEWPPGSRYEYHATSAHWVLTEVIHRVTGQDFRQALRARVLDPLGLDRLELGVPVERQADLKRVTATGTRSMEVLEALFGQPVDETALDADSARTLAVANDPEVVAAGVPGANAFSDAASVALFYQELLHNTAGLWRPDVLAMATGEIRNALPDPMRMGAAANRSIGLIIAGADDGAALKIPSLGVEVPLRPFGGRVSPRAFGHGGAGGQSAWADPATGLSFCLLVNGFDRDLLRDARRHAAIESEAAQWA